MIETEALNLDFPERKMQMQWACNNL